jgi:nucleoside-diphosphate-sugar epimerase
MAELKSFAGASALVVGGAGFVGSNLVRLLLNDGASSIIVVDNLLSSERWNLPNVPRVKLIEDSITSDKLLQSLEDTFDYVFHLSTFHGNQNSIFDPLADHENNTLTTLKLLERVRSFKRMKKLVYSSAGCAVAKKDVTVAKETTEEDPISLEQDSPYAMSKVFGEFYCYYYFRQHKVPTVRARFQNVYGPGEVLGAGKWRGTYATVWRNVVPVFVYKALHRKALPLENEGIGTRDFIFVEDICRGLMACALNGTSGGVYNIASGREISIKNLAEMINKYAGNEGNIEMKPRRAWDHSIARFGSTEKSKRELGFEASVPFEKGIATTIAWTRDNMPKIEETIAKHQHRLTS